jgi:hypothetical protein
MQGKVLGKARAYTRLGLARQGYRQRKGLGKAKA